MDDASPPTFGTRCSACYGRIWWTAPGRAWSCWACTPGPADWQRDPEITIINAALLPAIEGIAA